MDGVTELARELEQNEWTAPGCWREAGSTSAKANAENNGVAQAAARAAMATVLRRVGDLKECARTGVVVDYWTVALQSRTWRVQKMQHAEEEARTPGAG